MSVHYPDHSRPFDSEAGYVGLRQAHSPRCKGKGRKPAVNDRTLGTAFGITVTVPIAPREDPQQSHKIHNI